MNGNDRSKVAGQLALHFEPEEQPSADLLRRLAPLRPTPVYETYWRFASERQNVFFGRHEGAEPPWTSDSILCHYKFTNVYRAADRVSQFLIRNVIYAEPSEPEEVVFRILLFKLFNKIQTWKLLENAVAKVTWEQYQYRKYNHVLTSALKRGESIYSGAYIMPSATRQFGTARKHQAHLRLLEVMMRDALPQKIVDAKSLYEVFELLRSYPTLGDFLAYQFAIDLNYSPLIDFNEDEFVMPGPGAKSGIRKCFASLGGLSEADVIKFMVDNQETEFAFANVTFRSLWGRRLHLIDCQNLFCEVDKYARVRHPHFPGIAGRTRIKQKFYPNAEPIEYRFPPKWNIDNCISQP